MIPSANNATDYWISVFKDGNRVISDHINIGATYKFNAASFGAGNYYAWISAANSAGSIDSSGIEFSVIDSVGYSRTYLGKSAYSLDETVEVSVETICAKGQVIGIDKIGTGRRVIWGIFFSIQWFEQC